MHPSEGAFARVHLTLLFACVSLGGSMTNSTTWLCHPLWTPPWCPRPPNPIPFIVWTLTLALTLSLTLIQQDPNPNPNPNPIPAYTRNTNPQLMFNPNFGPNHAPNPVPTGALGQPNAF